MRRIVAAAFFALLGLCSSALAASTVNPNVPAQNDPLLSLPIRNNFLAAQTDINNILGNYASTSAPGNPVNLQTWVDTTTTPIYLFKYWNITNHVWVAYASLNINTNAYTPIFTSGGFAATPPIAVGVSGGVTTYSIHLDSNFTVVSTNLALASIQAGHLLANCTSGSAEPGNCAWTAYADQAIGASNGLLPYRVGGSWGTASTGIAGHVLPFLDGANTFSAAQSIYPGASGLPSAQTGTLLRLTSLDGTVTRAQLDAYGAAARFTGVRADGTAAVPTALLANDEIVGFNAWGNDGSSVVGAAASVQIYAAQNWSVGANGSYIELATTANGSPAGSVLGRMRVENDGGVTIPSTVSGGSKGSGTLNLLGNLYNNGTGPTGTGGYVRAIAPTITGHPTIEGITSTGATGTGNFVFDTNPTISGATLTTSTFTGTLSGIIAGTPTLSGANFVTLGNIVQDSTAWSLLGNNTSGTANYAPFTIGATANKASPVGADILLIQDSVGGGLKNCTLSACIGSLASGVAQIDAQTGNFTTGVGIKSTSKVIQLTLSNASLQSSTLTPTGTNVAGGAMMGLGTTCQLTPVYSGRIRVRVDFNAQNSTSSSGNTLILRWGTGTPPANGTTSLTGTQIGGTKVWQNQAASWILPVSMGGIVTGLTPGTAYWIDISAAPTAGTFTLTGVSCDLEEF